MPHVQGKARRNGLIPRARRKSRGEGEMAKPEPIPALKGKDAKELVARLKKPHASRSTLSLYRGALAEFRESRTEEGVAKRPASHR